MQSSANHCLLNAADTPFEIPEKVVAEAINNALAHRSYLSSASIQIEFYTDRVEIFSPGTLNPEITPEMLRVVHRSFPNNPLLADAMFLVRYIEQVGSGTTDIIDSCKALKLQEPVFNVTQNSVTTILYRENHGQKSGPESGPEKKNTQERILELMRTVPGITSRELSEQLDLARSGIMKHLRQLQLEEKIRHVGPQKSGHWEVL